MVRILAIGILSIILVGCGGNPVKPETNVVQVSKPILYCPAPNWKELGRPTLAIDGITDTTPDGEVVKRYKAAIKQLEDYSSRLEKALQRYDATNAAYAELRKQFLEQKAKGGFKEPSQ